MKTYEPNSFWVVTAFASVLTVILIAFLIWFAYIGHEPLEPIHDEEPHASIIKTERKLFVVKT